MLADTSLTASEEAAVDKLVAMLSQKMVRESSAPNTIKRDAHPKQIGLVRAHFSIERDLQQDLKVGLFQEPKTYDAWVRFSNQQAPVQKDDVPDIRGVGIKLVGVPGEKILPEQKNALTQDFVMISTDVFVTRNVEQFADLISALVKGPLWLGLYFLCNLRNLWHFISSNKRYGSILEARFWSVSPYQFGEAIVKYSLKPQSAVVTPLPIDRIPNYLTQTLERELAQDDYAFDFMVQFQKNPQSMPTEDLSIAWSETESPFIKVATLKIPKQRFNIAGQNDYGDQLSFSPWHSLPEHTPVGGINRARKIIYDALSTLRHEKNKLARFEPTNMEVPPA